MAGLSFSEELLRIVFFLANIIFWGIGIGLIVVGVHSIISVRDYNEFNVDYVTNGSGIIISLGILIFFIGFLGCYGAWNKSAWMLYGFAFFLFIFFCVEFSLGIFLMKNKSKAMDVFEKSLNTSMEHYSTDKPTRKAWDQIQTNFECCGIEGPDSWFPALGTGNVPDTCCITPEPECGTGYDNASVAVFSADCVAEVDDVLDQNLLVMALVAIIFAMLHWFGIVVACCLGNVFKQFQPLDNQ
ncbi:23 kDa integral membrane protein-like [Convolutriloba macropyga]|uniref:23 kDa integral membrane protein-like n=1 Tax=Convolutriloba macropyga TaxID=536237 RepID=UPI003F51F9A1